MKKYVIYVVENDTKVYIKIGSDGSSSSVTDKYQATVMPNRVVAQSIVSALKPAIKKQGLNVSIGFDVV